MKPIIIIAAALFLTACGGNSDPAPQNDPQTNTSVTIDNNIENNDDNIAEQVISDESTDNVTAGEKARINAAEKCVG